MSKHRYGYVYMLAGPNGAYKIGKTIDWKHRGQTFGVELPFDVEFVFVLNSSLEDLDYSELEKELHDLLSPYHIRGEWFLLSWGQVCRLIGAYIGLFDNEWMDFDISRQDIKQRQVVEADWDDAIEEEKTR